jgi:hypothetical protein
MYSTNGQEWYLIIAQVFSGLTSLVAVIFAALSSRDAKLAAMLSGDTKVKLEGNTALMSEIKKDVNSNFIEQKAEISELRAQLVAARSIAATAESTRIDLAMEAASVLAAPSSGADVIIKPGDVRK